MPPCLRPVSERTVAKPWLGLPVKSAILNLDGLKPLLRRADNLPKDGRSAQMHAIEQADYLKQIIRRIVKVCC